jgi:predicted aspartyl protease
MRIIALVAAMMLPAMAVAEPGDAGLQTSAPTQEEAIISSGADAAFRMTVPVMVNGQGPFHFVIDTGADRTVISRETADQLALPQAGTSRLHAMGGAGQVRMVKVDQLQMSNRTTKHLKLAASWCRWSVGLG